jgi:hypothetical protein
MTYYARSADRERQLVRFLRQLGFVAYRTPASKGAADVIAMGHEKIYLYQIKTGGSSAFSGFGPADRERLRDEETRAGKNCRAALVWWKKNAREPVVIYSQDWPE